MVCGRFAVAATVRVAAAVQSCPHPSPRLSRRAGSSALPPLLLSGATYGRLPAPFRGGFLISPGRFCSRSSLPFPSLGRWALFHLSCARSRRLNFLLHPSISIARGHIDLMNAFQSFSFPSSVYHERLTIHTHPFPPVVRGVFAFYCPSLPACVSYSVFLLCGRFPCIFRYLSLITVFVHNPLTAPSSPPPFHDRSAAVHV